LGARPACAFGAWEPEGGYRVGWVPRSR